MAEKISVKYCRIFFLLIICSAGILTATHAESKPTDTIHFATLNANYRVALEEIARKYEALHPEIQVEITIIAMNFETWIRTRFAAGGDLVPDIYNANFTAGYDRLGKWVELDSYLNSQNPYTGKVWHKTLEMSLLERYKTAGHFYQLPIDYVEIAIFYNKDIFDALKIKEPGDWSEFLSICKRIKKAGYAPIAIGGNAQSFWAGDMGWLVRMLGDVYLRKYVPDVMSQPGDWDYIPERNAAYRYNPDDLYSDLLVGVNVERLLNAVIDGTIDPRSEGFKRIYIRLKELSDYFQPGYLGTDPGSALQLFYRQKAAMIFLASQSVTEIIRDFKRLSQEDRFPFDTFWFPSITGDPYVCGSFRGVGGAGMTLAVTRKGDVAHEKNVMDFLMYMTTPENGKLLIERTLEEEQPIIGPLTIKGVTLPDELAEKYAVFEKHGYEKINFRGIEDEQESVAEWSVIAQEYMGGRLGIDEFSEQYAEILRRTIPRLQKQFGYDLNPATRDKVPIAKEQPALLNPFENGSVMLGILVLFFTGFAALQIRKSRGQQRQQTIVAYILLFPTIFLLGAFNYFPALSGLYHAFTEWEEGRVAIFNGLTNLKRMLGDEVLHRGFSNMLILLVFGLLKATIVPFVAAEMILMLISSRLRYLFRTFFLIPLVVPGMVGLLIWRFIYEPSAGLLNQLLETVGLGFLQHNWLGEPGLALPSIIFMGFPWVGALGLLIFFAGLINIPDSIYDSYRLESESQLRRILSIDVPLLAGQFRLLTILCFIGVLQDFQSILILTDGGPGLATTVPALRMYHQAFRFTHYGYGAAIGLALFVIILIISLMILKIFKRVEAD